ncbi:trigger factor [Planctomyces sp. SH-PL14]|uniref:trigger factor n=1 Tax=Planctomyces sp. SH-PL14 TaxID=1632864 RepID=UPI00078B5BF2|nr:trigger factor [Planctomyces sp. SH-PL14]AMV16320.1 Trigger factor [Planctomyces sp. SH-PL14]
MTESTSTPTAEEQVAVDAGQAKLQLKIDVKDVGPCKKHIRVSVERGSIDAVEEKILGDYVSRAEVPGFRAGRVPESLVRRRFKKELSEQLKQQVLMQSLEQLAEDSNIDPINEPNLDLDTIDIPEEGDFEYEFDVEVRPSFDLPTYKGLKIERPTHEVTDAEVNQYLNKYLEQYATLEPVEGAAALEDYITADVTFSHKGTQVNEYSAENFRVRPTLQFPDAELAGFDKLMVAAKEGDTKEAEFKISSEAADINMRGEPIQAKFHVLSVKRASLPAIDDDILARLGSDSEETLRTQVRTTLERQVKYEQRQACRRQVLQQITDSAKWELPEDLVSKQVENALNREILEMQQAGFTTREIAARENQLRQKSLTTTRQNLKEHFILDRVATEENIDVSREELENEIFMMAWQSGENPRRLRSRMIKTGLIENLHAQIRERKAVDVVLDNAEFKDIAMKSPVDTSVEAVDRAVLRSIKDVSAKEADEE